MIYPSIYSYNAPYRGPKEDKEISKLFSSIEHDLITVYDALTDKDAVLPSNLEFFICGDGSLSVKTETASIINDSLYSYKGIDDIARDMNGMSMRINNILEKL
jgi:hypothetical protein